MTQHDGEGSLDAVSELMLHYLRRAEDEGTGALEALCTEHPAEAEALRARVARLRASGLIEDEPLGEVIPEHLGSFRLIERLGGGGMGVVYRAVQEPLGREVALKLVRPDQLYFPEARERFQREVQVVARLQHPGVVRVHTSGEERGVPYFAMELIDGATLAEVLEELGEVDPAQLCAADMGAALARCVAHRENSQPAPVDAQLFSGSWVSACVRIAAQVAQALEHAHVRGVVHRDVKPSNVMLTPDGRAQLVDFGLSSQGGDERITRSGSALGSLLYVAPEILAGAEADSRSDVYELGATLFELLALAPPFRGADLTATRAVILAGGAPPLRARNPRVPRDLETVCLVALERDPRRRYGSAGAFARDLEAALALRPISARRAGWHQRAWRWCRREPARALALSLALLLFVGAPVGLAVERSLANTRLAREYERAEASLDTAVAAVVRMLAEVGAEELDEVPGMGQKRQRLLEESVALFDSLLPQRPNDPTLRLRRANLLRERGRALGLLDRDLEAEASLCEAERELRALEDPAPRTLARTLATRASNLVDLGRLDLAAELQVEAAQILTTLVGREQDASEILAELGQARRNLADTERRRGDTARALAELDAAIAAAERLTALRPEDPTATFELATARAHRGVVLLEEGRIEQAADEFARALGPLEALARAPGAPTEHRRELATLAKNHAVLLLQTGELEQGVEVAAIGVATLRELAREFPYRAELRSDLVEVSQNRAIGLAMLGRPEEAAEMFLTALAAQEELVHDAPDVTQRWVVLGMAASNVANILVELDRGAEAIGPGERSLEAWDRVLRDNPDHPVAGPRRPYASLVLAQARAQLGQYPDPDTLAAEVARRAPEDGQAWCVLAITMACCLSAVEDDAELDDSERAAQVERYHGLALRYLEVALDRGYDDLAALRQTAELAPLEGSPGYETLLSRLGQLNALLRLRAIRADYLLAALVVPVRRSRER